MNRPSPEQADYQLLMLRADVYRMPSGTFGGWQPPDLVGDRDHPFPREMAPIRAGWRERWRGRDDEGAVR